MISRADFKSQSSQMITLGAPILLGQLAQMSMAFVDTVVAGRAGAVEMAGVAVGGAFWAPLLLFGQGILNCIAPLVAQGMGAGQNKSLRHFLRQGMWLAFAISLLHLVLFSFASYGILQHPSIEPELAKVTSLYIDMIMWGMPAFLFFFVSRFFLEGMGHTRPAMVAGIVGLICNIPLNYIFVFGYLGMPKLGGAGCGLASAIVCWIMAAIMFYYVKKYSPTAMGIVKPQFRFIKRLLRIGAPNGFALLLEVSSFALISLFIAPLGSVTVAGHQIAMNVSSLVFMFPLSLGVASSIRIGSCLGAGHYEEAVKVRQTAIIMSVLLGSCLFALLFFARVPIAHIYSIDPEVIALASWIIVFASLYQLPDNVQIVSLASLRGYNDTKAIFIFSIIAYWIISIPLGYVLCFTDYILPKQGVIGFWMGLIAGLSIAAMLLMWRLLRLEKMSPQAIAEKIAK